LQKTLSEKIPYNEETLATVFDRPVNVIRLALEVFKNLGMIEIDEDGVIYLVNWEKNQNIDALEKIREDNRRRVAKFREHHKQLALGNVTVMFGNGAEENKNRIEEDKEEDKALLKKLVDEKRFSEITIGGQTLSYIIPLLKGEISCPAGALKFYKEALAKLGIELKDLGVGS